MSQPIFFAHANGFPSGTYGKLFAALAPEYRVVHLEQHAHDPRFPADDNWYNLVDELIHHLKQQAEPVWGVGHSFGGLLHLHAALRCPELYRGVVMLDSPVLTLTDRWVIRAAKRFWLYRPLDPGRAAPWDVAEEFADIESARRYFARAKPCSAVLIRNALMPTCNMVCTRSGSNCACVSIPLRKSASTVACPTPAPVARVS